MIRILHRKMHFNLHISDGIRTCYNHLEGNNFC